MSTTKSLDKVHISEITGSLEISESDVTLSQLIRKNRHKSEEFVRFQEYADNGWTKRGDFLICAIVLYTAGGIIPRCLTMFVDFSGSIYLLTFIAATFIIGVPLIYTEIFLGRYTRLTNCQLYRMAPVFFGLTVMIFIFNFYTVATFITRNGMVFVNLIRLIMNPHLHKGCHLNHPECYDYAIKGPIKDDDCRYCKDLDSICCEKLGVVRYPMMDAYWHLFRNPDTTFYPYSQLVLGVVLAWCIIFTPKKISTIATLIKITFFTFMSILSLLLILSLIRRGTTGLMYLVQYRTPDIDTKEFLESIWEIIRLFGLIVPSGHMTFSAYAKFESNTESDSLIIAFGGLILTTYYHFTLFSIASVIADEMGVPIEAVMGRDRGLYLMLIPEFFVCMKLPNILLIIYYGSFWLFDTFKKALHVYFLVLNFCDYFPTVKNFTFYIWALLCFLMGLISFVSCSVSYMMATSTPLYIKYFDLSYSILLTLEITMIYYFYGYSRLYDDILFATGQKPLAYYRVIWMISPAIAWLLVCVTLNEFILARLHVVQLYEFFSELASWSVFFIVGISASIMFVAMKSGKENLCLYLIKPQFYWGPSDRGMRISRKSFSPNMAIRSQPFTYVQRKSVNAELLLYNLSHSSNFKIVVQTEQILNDDVFFQHIGIYHKSYFNKTEDITPNNIAFANVDYN